MTLRSVHKNRSDHCKIRHKKHSLLVVCQRIHCCDSLEDITSKPNAICLMLVNFLGNVKSSLSPGCPGVLYLQVPLCTYQYKLFTLDLNLKIIPVYSEKIEHLVKSSDSKRTKY